MPRDFERRLASTLFRTFLAQHDCIQPLFWSTFPILWTFKLATNSSTAPEMANEISPKMLQQQQIPGLPPSMFYIPNFISDDEEQRILEKVESALTCFACVPRKLTQSPDTRKSLDLPQTPSPASYSSPTHCEQHPPRLVENATLAHDSRH
jgi:hypothetical protein